jgi:hypothetical protein
MKAIEATTPTEAWVKTASYLETQPNWKGYTLLLEIAEPLALTPADAAVYAEVDAFLRKHDAQPVSTVVNTIFPATVYARHGADHVLQEYARIAKRIRKHPDICGRWGTYAMRLTERVDTHGKSFNPLEALITKLEQQLKRPGPMGAAYELDIIEAENVLEIPVYDCRVDRSRPLGGPCLSHLSFKLKERKLMLTAVYRHHYYIERALGNLYGLAWLQEFVTNKLGIEKAELVCHSTLGKLDQDGGWTAKEISGLLKRCRMLLGIAEEAPVA